MPLFMGDLQGAGRDALDSSYVVRIISNPFLSAALATLVILGIIAMLISDLAPMDFARAGIFIYIALVVVLFINNRYLLQSLSKSGSAEQHFAFSSVPEVIGVADQRRPMMREPGPLPDLAGPPPMMQAQPQQAPVQPRPMSSDEALGAAYPTTWLSSRS